MNIIVKNSSDNPIYEQIKEQIKKHILQGDLIAGEKMPSIRELAKDLRISVITTKRAYDELINEGFVNAVQGKGCFVAEQNRDLIEEEYLKKIEQALGDALKYASIIKLSNNQLKKMISILAEEE